MRWAMGVMLAGCAAPPPELGTLEDTGEADPGRLPTGLSVALVLGQAAEAPVSLGVRFVDASGARTEVALALAEVAPLTYVGEADAAGVEALAGLVQNGRRSGWDEVWLLGPGETLRLSSVELNLDYEHHQGEWETRYRIHQEAMLTLGSEPVALSNDAGREAWLLEALGWTEARLAATPWAFQAMVHDLGKSGTDGSDAHDPNPRYGDSGRNLCSETVSWYYYESGVELVQAGRGDVEDLRDVVAHDQIREAFRGAGRLYCYDAEQQAWVGDDGAVSPAAGDYLDRLSTSDEVNDGHAMMIADWDEARGVATVLDGPWPVSLRTVRVHRQVSSGEHRFCLGRLPGSP